MPNRIDSEFADILDAVVARLIAQIPGLSDKNCFVSISEDPPFKVADSLFMTVAPSAGTFPDDLLAGGAQFQCTEETGVVVNIFSRFMAYRPGREREALSNWTRGILRMKKLVLKALVGQDLLVNAAETAAAAPTLRDLMLPRRSAFPQHVAGEDGLIKVAVEFALVHDWNLTE